MRVWQVVLGLAILVGLPVVQWKPIAAQESLWRRFTSQKGGFSVVIPGTPKERKDGNLTLFEVIRDDERVRYSVGYLDLPVAPGNDQRLQNEVYEGVRKGAEKDQAELISFRTIRLGSFPGREMNFKLPDDMVARWRIYLVNRRAYFVSVTTTKENQERGLTTSINVFLNSFRLVGKR
ncbi:hypothetical protein IQ250_26290 [Pseudanabaenaceae cyanobacterium LEGE 13415]|nr:hypothetical protein [Pseudanabaenaceae cyanobacterium LEGE 13415]